MVQVWPTEALAVKIPALVIAPHLAVQLTAMLAVNGCEPPWATLGPTGLSVSGDTTATCAVALPVPLVAVAVTTQLVVGYSGALKRPVDDTVPQLVFQVDGVLAVNWRVAFSCTLAEVGETVIASAVRDENARHTTTKTQKRGNCTTGSPEK
jgi:hypothetical protein